MLDTIFQVSLWKLTLATILRHLLGYFWYSPFLFGTAWLKALNKDNYNETEIYRNFKANSNWALMYSILFVYGLGILTNYLKFTESPILNASMFTILIGLLIITPVFLTHQLYDIAPKKSTYIHISYTLITIWTTIFVYLI